VLGGRGRTDPALAHNARKAPAESKGGRYSGGPTTPVGARWPPVTQIGAVATFAGTFGGAGGFWYLDPA